MSTLFAAIVRKTLELDEQLKSRLGVVILGDTGVGKTTVWRVLKAARLKASRQAVKTVIINPKALPRQRLLGCIDDDTREWNDGLLPCKAREIARGEEEVRINYSRRAIQHLIINSSRCRRTKARSGQTQ